MEKQNIIGEKIATYRSMLRLKRPAFIEELNNEVGSNYTSQALYSWETGKATPPSDLIPAIAKILQVNILQLFGDFEAPVNVNLIQENRKLSEELESMKRYVEELKGENKKLEGKLETSMSILADMMNRQEKNS